MSWWQSFRDSFRPIPEPARRPAAPPSMATRSRLSSDGLPNISAVLTDLAPLSASDKYRSLNLDANPLQKLKPEDLLTLLADLSPEISKAIWDFLRFCNPGWEVTAVRPSGRPAPGRAQEALKSMLTVLPQEAKAINVPLNRIFMGMFLRGAVFAEIVLDDRGLPVELVVPDPALARHRRVADPVRGHRWQLGQQINGRFTPLEYPTISYIPVDPMPGRPEGRSPCHPALYPTLFALSLLNDIRRVVQQQGYPRIDIEVKLEELVNSMPAGLSDDPEAFRSWVNGVIQEVQEIYSGLEPDDAYIHTDVVTVNAPKGSLGVGGGSIQGITPLMQLLERQATRALKTMPLLMGLDGTSNEAQANRQWEIHAAGIKSLQHLVEQALGRLLTVGLEAQGIAAEARIRFAELRAAEMLRDEQVRALRITNARNAYRAGYISQDEAALLALDKPQADVPEPRDEGGEAAPAGSLTAQPDPGSNRGRSE